MIISIASSQLLKVRLTMYIDPSNKGFLALFITVIIATIGFFIASIFLDFSGDVDLQKIEFKNSNFNVDIMRLKSDKQYVLKVSKGN